MAYRAQTAIIVAGHVLATLAAHRIALSESADRRKAVLMGIPLAVLMVAYTVFGLWLLSTPEIG
jgi:mannose/fructose/N-acetylgalactosamine-specific phosphotransferase system component IIC